MNNIEFCLQNKITTSNNKLQSTIFKAILNLYKKGFLHITARMVKEECNKIDLNIDWNNRLKAICNSMERTIECGVKIISENRPHNNFTIAFNGYTTNLEIKSTRNTTSKDVENRNVLEEKKSSENKIEDLKEKNSTSNNSVFLIPCSSSKISKEELEDKPFDINKLEFDSELGDFRKIIFDKLQKAKTHKRKKNKSLIDISNNFDIEFTTQAHKLYSKGKYYHSTSSNSLNWTENDKERIYIISALFGIIKANNYIPLYNLAMGDEIDNHKNFAKKFWKGKLDSIIEKLTENGYFVYNLLSQDYSYCLSKKSLSIIIKPNENFDSRGEQQGKWLKNNL